MNLFFKASFFQKIVLPAMLAILLFIASVYVFIIPTFERNALLQKQSMLHELTNTAWSILDKYHRDESNLLITFEEAQQKAIAEIEALRYGPDKKDYFWITDLTPSMIMHPYVHELTGKSLHDFSDPDGKRLFIEAVEIAKSSGEGFISYKWQLKDDSTHIVPKLSFVKKYEPWNWIIGTGIYLDDVQEEISSFTRKLILILLGITLIISLIIIFITIQSLAIENVRLKVEAQLLESKEKYKSLLESSTEGIVLLLNSKIAYSNSFIQNWLQYNPEEFSRLHPEEILSTEKKLVFNEIKNETRHEIELRKKDGSVAEAVLTILPVRFAEKAGLLLTFRDTSEHRSLKSELDELKSHLQNISRYFAKIAVTNNQTVSEYCKPAISCPADVSLRQALEIMNQQTSSYVLLMKDQECTGLIARSDMIRWVFNDIINLDAKASQFMNSPAVFFSEQARIAEAASLMEVKGVTLLVIKNKMDEIAGVLEKKDLFGVYLDPAEVLYAAIEKSNENNDLGFYRKEIPFLIKTMLNEVVNAQSLTRTISMFSDAISRKIIQNAINELGEPPVPFVFIVIGSEGREEPVFNSDQDNAIIFRDDPSIPLEIQYDYFNRLAAKVCRNLDETGLPLCKGNFMADNSKWCQPISIWKEYFNDWIVNSDPQNILNISVFFDLRMIFGKHELFKELEEHVFHELQGRSAFFYMLAQSLLAFKPPINVFGNIVTETSGKSLETIDIKHSLAPVIMFARIYALHNSIRTKGTVERMNMLKNLKVLSPETCDELIFHFNFLMLLRIRHQIRQIDLKAEISNYLEPKKLSEMEQLILRKVFSQINSYQDNLSASFMGGQLGI